MQTTSRHAPGRFRRPRTRGRIFLGSAGVLSLSLGLAACSSSTSTTTTTTAAPASSTSTTAASNTQVAAAQALVAQYEKQPTTIGVTTPLKSKPPTGKTFVWLSCDVSQCATEGAAIQQAVGLLGWNYKQINYKDADPATLVAGLQQALLLKPVAVALSGLPEVLWQTEAAAYKAAGVPIIQGYEGPGPVAFPLIGSIGGPSDVSVYGKMLAEWTIADSNGKANVLNVTVNSYPILAVFSSSFQSTLTSGCSGCKIQNQNFSLAQVFSGGVNSGIVAALRRDPSITYVNVADGPFIDGLPSALAAAGLSGKVKITAESGDTQNLTDVQNGTESAFTGLALNYGSYLMVDLALRHLEGMPITDPTDGGLPKQLLVKGVSFAISISYDEPSNFRAQFKTLWLLG